MADTASLAAELADAYGGLDEASHDTERTAPIDVADAGRLYRELWSNFPRFAGKIASRGERESKSYTSTTLVYGEIEFEPFAATLCRLRDRFGHLYVRTKERCCPHARLTPLPAPRYGFMQPDSEMGGGVFVDVGCGCGKPVFAAALCHPWERCVGVEILQSLHALCLDARDEYDASVRPRLPSRNADTELLFLHGDATVLDWSNADVVFMNSTCFDTKLMAALLARAENLRDGAILITMTMPVRHKDFTLLEQAPMDEQWGEATVFCHVKGKPIVEEEAADGGEGGASDEAGPAA